MIQLKRMNDPELDRQFQLVQQALSKNVDFSSLACTVIEATAAASSTVFLPFPPSLVGEVAPRLYWVQEGAGYIVPGSVSSKGLSVTNLVASAMVMKVAVIR